MIKPIDTNEMKSLAYNKLRDPVGLVFELCDELDRMREEKQSQQGKTVRLFLYRVTLRGMQSSVGGTAYGMSYVVATCTDEAYRMVRDFLDKNDLGFSDDRVLQKNRTHRQRLPIFRYRDNAIYAAHRRPPDPGRNGGGCGGGRWNVIRR